MKLNNLRPKSQNLLMLTPFLDVLTVLLIYLIITFAPEEASVELNPQIKLPESQLTLATVPSIRLEVSDQELKINGEKIEGIVPASASSADWDQLAKNLKNKKEADNNQILIVADKSTTFKILDVAFAQASAAGFSDIYLLTEMKHEEGEGI